MTADPNIPTTILAETQNYIVWTADEPDGETTYNVELGSVTLHFFKEEWEEFLKLIRALPRGGDSQGDGGGRAGR
jgi:hypothetical protein